MRIPALTGLILSLASTAAAHETGARHHQRFVATPLPAWTVILGLLVVIGLAVYAGWRYHQGRRAD